MYKKWKITQFIKTENLNNTWLTALSKLEEAIVICNDMKYDPFSMNQIVINYFNDLDKIMTKRNYFIYEISLKEESWVVIKNVTSNKDVFKIHK